MGYKVTCSRCEKSIEHSCGSVEEPKKSVGKSRILEKKYSVETWNENGWWLARVQLENGGACITQGRTKEELWAMIADAVLTAEDVPLSWWNRIVSKLLIF